MDGTARRTAPFNDPEERANIRESVRRANAHINAIEKEAYRREKNKDERQSRIAWVVTAVTIASVWPQVRDAIVSIFSR